MKVFAVAKPGGTNDYEFVAYTHLLEEIGVDVASGPRVREPGTDRRWLYVWDQEKEAEAFAQELRQRTRDALWEVHQFEIEEGTQGPVAPLDIYEVRDKPEERQYYLAPVSRERVIRKYPHTKLYPVTISKADLASMKEQVGEAWWDQLCILVTGLSMEKVKALGGYRVILPGGEIGYEQLPQD